MKRLPTFLVIVALVLVYGSLLPDGGIGFGTECSEGHCRSWAQGSLTATILGPLIGLLVRVLPREETVTNPSPPVGVFRRLGALYLNLGAIMVVYGPLADLPVLLVEATHTGTFQWSYIREFSRDTDFLVGGGGVLFLFAASFYHYYRALILGRATIGQYLMGYQVIRTSGPWTRSSAMKRMGHTLLNLCAWPIAVVMALRNDKKAFWWDLKTDSIAERFAYAGEAEEEASGD